LIQLNSKLILVQLDIVKAILLSNCSCLTDILLKEFATEKEMVGFSMLRANVEAIVMKLCHRDVFALMLWSFLLRWAIFSILISELTMPSKLASGKKQDISQGGIKRMKVRNALQRAIPKIKDKILRISDLVPITWNNDSYLFDRGIRGIVASPITILIKVERD
jgi:hypothetical protein